MYYTVADWDQERYWLRRETMVTHSYGCHLKEIL